MHFALLFATFALLARPFVAAGLTFCATENTGSSYSAVSDTFQSNGACELTCSQYALGVLQGKKCWCSNVAPAESSQKDISECSTGCPGYPNDSCGSAAEGVWAYVKIPGNEVTTTAGEGSTPTTTTTSSTGSETTTTGDVVKETTAAGGQVKTITVSAPSATSALEVSGAEATSSSSGLSGGSIAGIVIGVIGGLALIGALIFLVFLYRRRARATSPVASQDMTDRTSQGSSFVRGVFPQGHSHDLSGSSTLGRNHQAFTDNRMKSNIYPNGDRGSSVSLQDNEDYSRPVLRLTNPD